MILEDKRSAELVSVSQISYKYKTDSEMNRFFLFKLELSEHFNLVSLFCKSLLKKSE